MFGVLAFVCAVHARSVLSLCDLMDCGPTGSSVHGILQARILERECWAPLVAVRIALKSSVSVLRAMESDFYLRYYVGHKGKFGHEFLEFEFRPDGKLRYANNSNYKNDVMIRKEAYVPKSVMEELKRIIDDSEITKEDDALWPPPDRVGRQVRVLATTHSAEILQIR